MSRDFEVICENGYVEIRPHPSIAVSAESLLEVVQRIRKGLRFGTTKKIEVGTSPNHYSSAHTFALRLQRGTPELADRLCHTRDLFPPLIAERLTVPEVRFVHRGLAYVDPRLVLPAGKFAAFANAIREHFGVRAVLTLQGGQFTYNPNCARSDMNQRMLEFCGPIYEHLSSITAENRDERPWIHLQGPSQLLAIGNLAGMKRVYRHLQPVLSVNTRHDHCSGLWIPIDAPPATGPNTVRRLYTVAANIALGLGVHPVGHFDFSHDERLQTTFNPPPLTSR